MKIKKQERRFWAVLLAFISVIALFNSVNLVNVAHADEIIYDGAWGHATTQNLTVYNEYACTTVKGTIYANEGFTILKHSYNAPKIYVEYSTSTGAKRGYVKTTNAGIEYGYGISCVARVISNTTVYYGNSMQSFLSTGTVYANEIVVVLGNSGYWAFIEYNTTSGRKRGYVLNENLYFHNELDDEDDYMEFYDRNDYYNTTAPDNLTVYSGPSDQYTVVGSLDEDDDIRYYGQLTHDGNTYAWYVSYIPSGQTKRKAGYILFDIG